MSQPRKRYPKTTYADLGEMCLIAAVLAGKARELETVAQSLSRTATRLENLRLEMDRKKRK